MLATSPLPVAGEDYMAVEFHNDGRHLVITTRNIDGDFEYRTWTVDLDTLFESFSWLPDLPPGELAELGL